ncbi:peptidoglycan-binding protein LysM [Flavobacteriaceae bacterium]|nr:peptidoglycan-binding protein LysM [Flavobacteriaceae bacterium]
MRKTIIQLIVILGILSTPVQSFAKSFYVPNTTEIATVLTEEEARAEGSMEYLPIPYLGKTFTGFKEALAFKESQGRYQIINAYGYLGKYQFGKSTLERLQIDHPNEFLKDPELQERAFIALCQVNKWILRKDISRMVGKKVNGITITESGILAAAHLGGAGNVKKYLRSWGSYQFEDAFGTNLEEYLKKFSGYDTSGIEANRFPEIS